MQAQNGGGTARPLIHVMHAQRAARGVVNVRVMRVKRIVGQARKPFVGGAQGFHCGLLCRAGPIPILPNSQQYGTHHPVSFK